MKSITQIILSALVVATISAALTLSVSAAQNLQTRNGIEIATERGEWDQSVTITRDGLGNMLFKDDSNSVSLSGLTSTDFGSVTVTTATISVASIYDLTVDRLTVSDPIESDGYTYYATTVTVASGETSAVVTLMGLDPDDLVQATLNTQLTTATLLRAVPTTNSLTVTLSAVANTAAKISILTLQN